MTKIINAYLTRTDTIWHFRSVMDLYYLCAVGQREVMPSQQNDQHHRTLSQQNNEVEVRDGFDQDAQQNVTAGKQRCNFARFPCIILLRIPYAVGQTTYCFLL